MPRTSWFSNFAQRTIRQKPTASSTRSSASRIFPRRSGPGTATATNGRSGIHRNPAEPADPALLPPMLKGFSAVPPLVTDIDLSMDDRFLTFLAGARVTCGSTTCPIHSHQS